MINNQSFKLLPKILLSGKKYRASPLKHNIPNTFNDDVRDMILILSNELIHASMILKIQLVAQ